jgi:hypothetical protein
MEPWPWSLKMAAFIASAVFVLWLGSLGHAQSASFLGEVASELGGIEADVRTGILPGLAGVLLAMIAVAVGVAVVNVFMRGR